MKTNVLIKNDFNLHFKHSTNIFLGVACSGEQTDRRDSNGLLFIICNQAVSQAGSHYATAGLETQLFTRGAGQAGQAHDEINPGRQRRANNSLI